MNENKMKKASLAVELKEKADELAINRASLLKNGGKVVLQSALERIELRQGDFTPLMIGKIQTKAIQNLTASILVDAAKGLMLVPHYSPSTEKSSPVWVYVGTHWVEVPDPQIIRDFICDGCHKMGLHDMFVNDVKFIDRLIKQIEHMLSRHPELPDMMGGVTFINFLNGTLEVAADGQRSLRPHRREDFFRYVLPYNYDPDAECPRFLKFLDEVLPDQSTHLPILEYIAYCFVPWLRIEKILGFLGNGANGKSTLIRLIERLLGKESVTHESLHDLTTNETHRANIELKLANLSTENEGHINTAAFRTLVSGEPISCRKYYSQPYEMEQYAKMIFSFNEMPKVKSLLANQRRWMLAKFDVIFSEEEADADLDDKLESELSGIMNLVLDTLPALIQRKKFTKSVGIEHSVKEMEYSNDPILQFLDMRCESGPGISGKGSTLHRAFNDYAVENGYRIMSNQAFYKRLRELGHSIPDNGHQPTFDIKVVRYED